MRLFPWKRAEQAPGEGEEGAPDEGEEKSSKHGLSADQVELIEKLVVLALGAIEPAEKLVHVLMHVIR